MTISEKHKIADGYEIKKLTDEYRQMNQEQYILDNIV